MIYNPLQPAFTRPIKEMSKSELKKYFEWFLTTLPQRVYALAGAVRSSPGFETWQADETPESLGALGAWFEAQVKTRTMTSAERNDIVAKGSFPVEIPSDELTEHSLSVAMDVGMYFSQTLIKNYPSLRWQQPLNNKNFVDYGQPVLSGFGPVALNPVRTMIVLSYGLADKSQTGHRLRELYDYWAARVQTEE